MVWVLECRVLFGWPGGTPSPPGWESTPPTCPDWEPIHLMVQGGHHPNAWTRGGYIRPLLCVAGRRGRVAGGVHVTGLGTRPPIRPNGNPESMSQTRPWGSSHSSGNTRGAGSGEGYWQAIVVARIVDGWWWVGYCAEDGSCIYVRSTFCVYIYCQWGFDKRSMDYRYMFGWIQ